ncbi:Hypothetical predicted protein [Paramuricea clavata]|uniref:Uncharacterized protein n=1 Tax=Paramuricea clavata TaxID=317549 RepID=A0A6S7H6N0_PARCT|nr:Hypothetical predicted protein [Paramuricea clavata]
MGRWIKLLRYMKCHCMQSLAVRGYDIKIECINAEKGILTCLPNPKIVELKRQNPRLGEVSLCEEKTISARMPVHIMLGVSDFQRIRTSGNLILGTNPDTDPGAEFTMLGLTVFGGKQNGMQPVKNFLLHPAQKEFEKLCNLDVLGVADPIDKQVESTEIMNEAAFELHKWHSNCPAVKSTNNANENETTYAKTFVGNVSSNETKILGLPWNKKTDAMTINFETCIEVKKPVTKRKVIGAINSVYDILGWSSPIIITAKIIFAEICLLKKHWDEPLLG